MGLRRHCDICGRGPDPGEQVVSFSLRFELFEPTRRDNQPRKHMSITGGSIDLCLRCWERIGKPRQRPKRRVISMQVEDLFKGVSTFPSWSRTTS